MGAVGTEPTQTGGGQLVWKNSARLADGREIMYFDESPGLNRALARDTRDGLAPVPTPGAWRPESPEQAVRWDPLLGEWVVIAAQRQDRTFLPPPDQCPLDPSAPGRPTEIPADSYDVVVFENRFPSLRGASALPGTEAADQAGPALDDGLSPQLKYLAGTESGMGVWINDIVPETAARRLREAG
jgi:UDPglucose--hexose-1-phosphate uridylyltransferase